VRRLRDGPAFVFRQCGLEVDDCGQIGQVLAQVAVVVERFDHETRDLTVALVEPIEP
jgi:hypothetical protein